MVNNNQLSNVIVDMDMSSFTVDNFEDAESKNKLTGHLKSDDFFKISTFPTSKFELTSLEESTGDFNSLISGNLTILDVTKNISFEANVNVSANEVSIKSKDFVVDRRDWGLSYNTEGTTGVPTDYLISDEVGFTINIIVQK